MGAVDCAAALGGWETDQERLCSVSLAIASDIEQIPVAGNFYFPVGI